MPSCTRLMKTIKFVGARNVLLGSDTPYGDNSLEKNINRVRGLDIDEKDMKLILGDNMRRLLNLW